MKIIQITGYKNSGKTTLSSEIIETFTKTDLKVGALKHHGHGGTPLGFSNTDSEKHRKAGATIAGVEGEGVFQLSAPDLTLEQVIEFYAFMKIDVLVVEGFKDKPFPKLVLLSEKEDRMLLDRVENIKAVVSSLTLEGTATAFPTFNRDETAALLSWLKQDMIDNKRDYEWK